MARRKITQYFDDLDNAPLTEEEVTVVRFRVDDTDYVLDVSHDNAREFYNVLEPFVQAAREETVDVLENVDPAAVRKWAQDKGLTVAHRGKIPHHIMEAYRDAHS